MRKQVIVLERQPLMRDALAALLSAAFAPATAHGAATLPEALAALAGLPGAVALVDTSIADVIAVVRGAHPTAGIIALAAGHTRDDVLRCLAAGAHGYVSKSAPAAELLAAVEAVAAGRVHVPEDLGPAENRGAAALTTPIVEQLTGRQRDVLMLMAEGRSTKDIARTLDLAVSTIKVHLAAVYRAVGARNRVQALCRAGLMPAQIAAS